MNTVFLSIVNKIVHAFPATKLWGIKRFLFRLCGIKIGSNVKICSSVTFLGDSDIFIGDNVWIGHETMIVASAPVNIGDNVNIAPRCYIGTGTHDIDIMAPSVAGKGKSYPISIEEGVWCCTHVVVLPNTTIGGHSILAAGAVVNKSIPSGQLWGGVPAKFIRSLD